MCPQNRFAQKDSPYMDLICNRNHIIYVPSGVEEPLLNCISINKMTEVIGDGKKRDFVLDFLVEEASLFGFHSSIGSGRGWVVRQSLSL